MRGQQNIKISINCKSGGGGSASKTNCLISSSWDLFARYV